MHKQLGREANDIRLDHQLAAACAACVGGAQRAGRAWAGSAGLPPGAASPACSLVKTGPDVFPPAPFPALCSDVKEHCGVKPGSARVIHCLQDARAKLRADCSTKLFLHEQRLAGALGLTGGTWHPAKRRSFHRGE